MCSYLVERLIVLDKDNDGQLNDSKPESNCEAHVPWRKYKTGEKGVGEQEGSIDNHRIYTGVKNTNCLQ